MDAQSAFDIQDEDGCESDERSKRPVEMVACDEEDDDVEEDAKLGGAPPKRARPPSRATRNFLDEAAETDSSGQGGEEEDEANEQNNELFVSMATKKGRLDAWTLGEGTAPFPPSNDVPMSATGWAMWEKDSAFVPYQHLAFNMVDTCMDPTRTGVFKSSPDEAINSRNAAMAAIFGLMLDYEAKGIFVDGHKLYPYEKELPGGETPVSQGGPGQEDVAKARAKAIKALPPLSYYQFKFKYPAVCVTENGEKREVQTHENFVYLDEHCSRHDISASKQRELAEGQPSEVCTIARVAPCEMFVMETLYGVPNEVPEEGADPRGPVVGVRAHKLLFNRHMRPCEYVHKIIDESHAQWRHARASLCEDEKRGDVSSKAGKSTRAWVADADVGKTSIMKYAAITDNAILAHTLMQCGGAGCGGETRHIYPNMTTEFGAGAALTPIKFHTERSQHALAPECALNFRDGCRCYAKHPHYNTHKQENPELYALESARDANGHRPYKHYATRVANAFMLSLEGVPIKLMPEQADANNYITETGAVRFPYPETCYVLVNPLRSKRDSTLPNRISTIPQVGTNVLKAFYAAKRSESAIQQSVDDTRLHMAANNLMAGGTFEPTAPQLETEIARLRNENKPSIDEICRHLMPVFTDMLCPSTAQSAISKRLEAGRHVQPDSLDQSAADVAARRGKLHTNFSYQKKVEMKDERLAVELSKVHDVVMEGAGLLHATGKAAYSDFRYKVKSELIEWFIKCFDEMYFNPLNAQSLWPNHLKVWQTTMQFIKALPERAKTFRQSRGKKPCARVDASHPHSGRGSANFAFLFDFRIKKSGLSPYGNYQNDVLSFLYYEVCGILGQSNHIRNALHMLPFFASCPLGFRPILVINGKPGMCKSKAVECFSLIWNRPDLPEERSFFFASGSGSNNAYQAGEISPASGGVLVWDEPPRELTSSATKDEALNNQKQNLKEICTNGSTNRPRCEQKIGPDGATSYIRCEYQMRANHPFCCCSNLGAATYNDFKARPNDGKALEHRMVPLLSAEALPAGVMPKGTDTIKDDLAEHADALDAHTLVVSLTQMCLAMASLMKSMRPPREDLLIKTFGVLDDFVEKNYGISKPDSRRLELRRHEAMAKAFESAVVRVFLYKEEAVNYDHMLPISKPHTNGDVDGVHTLAPFDLKHLVKVFQIVCYDMEVILEAWSSGLDRSLYTAPDTLHLLLAIGKMHGIEPELKKTKFRGEGASSAAREAAVDADAAPTAARLQRHIQATPVPSQVREDRESEEAGAAAAAAAAAPPEDGRTNQATVPGLSANDRLLTFGSGIYDDGSDVIQQAQEKKRQKVAARASGSSSGNFDAAAFQAFKAQRAAAAAASNAAASAPRPRPPEGQSPSFDERLSQANAEHRDETAADQRQEAAAWKIQFSYMNEFIPQSPVPELELQNRMEVLKRRQRVLQYFMRLRKGVDLDALKGDATHRDIVAAALRHAPARSNGVIVLPWTERGRECTMTVDEIASMTLPVLHEVLSCGYHQDDLQRWLAGAGSMHMFTSRDADNVFVGVHTNSFNFEKRPGAQNTALSCDICWRTCSSEASKGEEAGGGGGNDGGGAGAASSGSRRAQTIEEVMKTIARNAERLDLLRPFKIDFQQLFDRMNQIAYATQDDFRTILVSPSSAVLRSSGPTRGERGSVIREFDRAEVGKYRNLSNDVDPSQSFKSIDDVSTVRMVIPSEAVRWTKEPLHEKSADAERPRSGDKQELIVGDVDDPTVKRLDALLEGRALPAADMVLNQVIRGNPIKCTDREVYINSAFFIEQCRLNQEIDVTLLTIPGLRSWLRCDKPGIDQAHDPCKREAMDAIDAVAEEITKRTTFEPTDADCLKCLQSCFFLAAKSGAEQDDERAGAAAAERPPPRRDGGEQKMLDKSGELFEKLGIFLTFTVHALFDWSDPAIEKTYLRRFKKVFQHLNQLRASCCESATRFFQRVPLAQYERTPKRLSFAHLFFASDKDGEDDRNDARRAAPAEERVTEEELNRADEVHWNIHGNHVYDEDDLRLLALSLRGSSNRQSGSFLQRHVWRTETLKAKIDSGMISETEKFQSAALAATSTNSLLNVMCEVAIRSNEEVCNVSEINDRAAYLRPMRFRATLGTCKSNEIETTRRFLAEKVKAKVGAKHLKDVKDISMYASSRGKLSESCDPNIGADF